jgi:hypothetical protein
MNDKIRTTRSAWLMTSSVVLATASVLALGQAASAAVARPRPPKTIYAVTNASDSALYRISPRTHGRKLIGRAGIQLTDLSFRGASLYAISFTSLYRLNTRTGASTYIGALGVSSANALATQPKTRTLYGADQYGDFFKVNPRTGQIRIIGTFGHGLGSLGDLTFSGTRLYAMVYRSGSTRGLLATVNVRTGAAKVVGRTGFANVYGLVTGQGALYGATANRRFLAISAKTGHAKAIWKDGLAVAGLATP